jgi:hypothetical protein
MKYSRPTIVFTLVHMLLSFRNEIDSYTMYFDLNGNSTAQSADDCKANCCKDASCQVWQWSDVRSMDCPFCSDCTYLAGCRPHIRNAIDTFAAAKYNPNMLPT